jgi:hypothetical protein
VEVFNSSHFGIGDAVCISIRGLSQFLFGFPKAIPHCHGLSFVLFCVLFSFFFKLFHFGLALVKEGFFAIGLAYYSRDCKFPQSAGQDIQRVVLGVLLGFASRCLVPFSKARLQFG